MLANLRARQRHQKLMRAAHHLLQHAAIYNLVERSAAVTAPDLVAYVFGRHQIDLDTDEAQKFLTAARVSRGDAIPATNTAVHHSA